MHKEVMFANPYLLKKSYLVISSPWRWSSSSIKKTFFLVGIALHAQIYIEKLCLPAFIPSRVGWGSRSNKKFFRNYVECPDLHRKVMFANSQLTLHWVEWGLHHLPFLC